MKPLNLTEKILLDHLVDENELPAPGSVIKIRVDEAFTQDATGTMCMLQLEAMGVKRVKPLSVNFVDHSMLQVGFRNPDDHEYLKTVAQKLGIVYSPAGTGICHFLNMENFVKPGMTGVGADSHTVNAGGCGAIFMGAGGYDVALAMATGEYSMPMPKVVKVNLTGALKPGAMAMDVILKMLEINGVKGGKGVIFEYAGPGVASLSLTERATITNMGAEMGATTSIFPSDERTQEFLESRGRGQDYQPLAADEGAEYERVIDIDLSALEPLIAIYPSPGNVEKVADRAGTKINQVSVGSCTNSSYENIASFAELLKGKRVTVDTLLYPGSRAVAMQLAESGYLTSLYASGVRIQENGCGACIGQGGSPVSKGISLRTFNRNFPKRSGTADAEVHLVSPLVAAASALAGEITVPQGNVEFKQSPAILDTDSFIMPLPPAEAEKVEVIRGPNIMALPDFDPLPDTLKGEVLLKLGDNISTDDIQPAGTFLPLRSNVKEYAMQATFNQVDPSFSTRACEHRDAGGHGIIVGGENYGQGSSREHAALCPRWLGVRAVVVSQFARIHVANLVNFGIVPLTFANEADYDKIKQGDTVSIDVSDLEGDLFLEVNGKRIPLNPAFEPGDVGPLKAGGALPLFKMTYKG
ncbi:aconitate hydratase [Candidatus Endoriftia persephonae]|jgi:aconitate hydratase|uniref:Aconitate hydratase A n=2 Tax=Gammaproteobacteria TaxID=1236 RepID=G2FI25_9GAMM|nr:aconitate hydratase [Candidatus Endoriftia persephone]EGW53534.1 aconitate hydratase [endosymbiont of Tevnia jerichonana (vent Tica)]USF86856.1 aconitate hydratase [Candidatus Endoriftia persephone]